MRERVIRETLRTEYPPDGGCVPDIDLRQDQKKVSVGSEEPTETFFRELTSHGGGQVLTQIEIRECGGQPNSAAPSSASQHFNYGRYGA